MEKKLITEIDRMKEIMGLSLLNESNFVHVVNGKKVGVTSPYGNRKLGWHHGIDLGTPSGTKILAPADGKVIEATFKSGRCGGQIYIDHGTINGKNIRTRYCHIKELRVNKGDNVAQGQIIGLSGGGAKDKGRGRSTGPHLHWEVYENGNTVNPINYYNNSMPTTANLNPKVEKNTNVAQNTTKDKKTTGLEKMKTPKKGETIFPDSGDETSSLGNKVDDMAKAGGKKEKTLQQKLMDLPGEFEIKPYDISKKLKDLPGQFDIKV